MVSCVDCGAENARNGKSPNKYCDRHIPEGVAQGHINSKRMRSASPAASSSSTAHVGRLPDGWKLLELKNIYASRS